MYHSQQELMQDVTPIIRAAKAGLSLETIEDERVRIKPQVHTFPGDVVEQIAAYCRANSVHWIVTIDKFGAPVIILNRFV